MDVTNDVIRDSYARDGYLVLPRLLSAGECAELKREAEDVLRRHGGPESTVYVGLSVHSPRYRALHADERLLRVLRPLMPTGIAFLSDKAVFKSQDKRFATPWHVDAAYWRGTRPKLSVWIALDEARADNGCLTVVRGSHHRDFGVRAGELGATNQEFANVVERSDWPAADALPVPLAQGGVIVFGDRTVHGSTGNVSGEERWSAILTYHAPADPEEAFDLQFPARHALAGAG
jgi:ectoine hydroxylase-related dioxygenase (phytanoyl-CoA dioxygenase family)